MGLPDVISLMNFARSLDQSKMQRVTLGPPYSHSAHINGKDVVMLDCTQVQPIIAKMFDLGDKAQCNMGSNSSTSATLSTSTQLPSTPNGLDNSNAGQLAGQLSTLSTLSINQGNQNLFGIHSLLDLMFMVVFESPDGMRV